MSPADDYDIGFTGARFGGSPRKRRSKKGAPAAPPPATPAASSTAPTADEADTAAMAVVPPATAAPPAAPPAAVPPAPAVPAADPAGFHEVPDLGFTGARFGGSSRRRRDKEANPEPIRVLPEPAPAPEPLPEDLDDEGGRSLAVRPYFYTKGRTRSRFELAIETLVSTPPAALSRPELAEHLPILRLCAEPRSIAEVGALMGMPLGVARVVVGDLAVTGGLEVHSTVSAEGPDVTLMERVLAGLRRL